MYANYLHNGATLLFPYIWNLKILPIKQNHVGYSYLFPMYDTETNSQRKKSFDKRFFFSDQYTHPHITVINSLAQHWHVCFIVTNRSLLINTHTHTKHELQSAISVQHWCARSCMCLCFLSFLTVYLIVPAGDFPRENSGCHLSGLPATLMNSFISHEEKKAFVMISVRPSGQMAIWVPQKL